MKNLVIQENPKDCQDLVGYERVSEILKVEDYQMHKRIYIHQCHGFVVYTKMRDSL